MRRNISTRREETRDRSARPVRPRCGGIKALLGCLLTLALTTGVRAQPPTPARPVHLSRPVTASHADKATQAPWSGQVVQSVQPVDPKPPTPAPKDPPAEAPKDPPPSPTPTPGPGRLPLLGLDRGGFGGTPTPTAREQEEFNRFVEKFIDPRNTLDLVVGRTRLMMLKETPTQTQIADEETASLNVLNPKQLILIGRRVGNTVLTLWFKDPKDGSEKILSYLVRVLPDPEAKARLEAIYKALEEEINEAFPDANIQIRLVGDKIVVCGQAKDVVEATQILRIVRANAPQEQDNALPVQNVTLNVTPDPLNPDRLPSVRDFLVAGGPNIINLIRIPGEQQVMLRVTVAEINRAAARSIGLNFRIVNNQGVQVFANNTGNIAIGGNPFLFGGAGLGGGGGANAAAGLLTNNLPVSLDNGQISLAINALRNLNYARSLAEPNLVAMNGQTASFQAGGQFPVPVVTAGTAGQNQNFGGLQGVNFIPYGVLLNFTPIITDKDRIRLTIASEVSTRDLSSGSNIGGSNVPGLNTRNFQTTVELREGETLAVAGLIQNNLGATGQRIPLIGDLPILNNLTGFQTMTAGEQELVVLVTPELVHPLEKDERPAVPGSDLFEPSDLEFYVFGRLEGRRPVDYRSTVRTDVHRMKAFKLCEDTYIYGPSGHADGHHEGP